MRKRPVLVLCWLSTVLLIGCLALWVAWPGDRINREHFAKIQPGMTEGEVEAILGGAPGNGPGPQP
jgi:hypothetical protein